MKNRFIKTRNYIKLYESMSRLKRLPLDADRMGLAYGSFGLGKSVSLERIVANEDAILLRCDQTWSVSSVLKRLCEELKIDERGRSSTLFNRVIETLLIESRVIIIDEIDTLLRSGKSEVFELFRDIHDETKSIVFFVGMENSLAKIKRHKHYFSRLTEIVKFEPIGRDDIAAFCELCEVEIKEELIDYFAKRYANLREIRVFLIRIEEWAELNEVKSVGLEEFRASGVMR